MTQSSEAKRGDVLVLVGTRKGGFILSSDASRKRWSVSEPQFAGGEPVAVDSTPGALKVSGPAGDIFHMAYDPRDGGTIVAAISNAVITCSHPTAVRSMGVRLESSSVRMRGRVSIDFLLVL